MRVSCLMCFVRVPILRLGLFETGLKLGFIEALIDNIVKNVENIRSVKCSFITQDVLISLIDNCQYRQYY